MSVLGTRQRSGPRRSLTWCCSASGGGGEHKSAHGKVAGSLGALNMNAGGEQPAAASASSRRRLPRAVLSHPFLAVCRGSGRPPGFAVTPALIAGMISVSWCCKVPSNWDFSLTRSNNISRPPGSHTCLAQHLGVRGRDGPAHPSAPQTFLLLADREGGVPPPLREACKTRHSLSQPPLQLAREHASRAQWAWDLGTERQVTCQGRR